MEQVPMDGLLDQTKAMVTAIQKLQVREAAATQRAQEEAGAHTQTREQVLRTQEERDRIRDAHSQAVDALAGAQAAHEALKSSHADISADNDQLRSKLKHTQEEFVSLQNAQYLMKSQLDAALQAQAAYKKEYHATRDELMKAREEIASLRAENAANEETKTVLETSLAQTRKDFEAATAMHTNTERRLDDTERRLAEAVRCLGERERALRAARAELEGYCGYTREIKAEFGKVQDVLECVLGAEKSKA